MDRAGALATLTEYVAATQRPALETATLDRLLDLHRVPDVDGRPITDPAWVPTWDLDRAAAEGWRWKAARVAGDFDFTADGSGFSKGAVMAKCLEMADQYAARGLRVLGAGADRDYPPYDSPRLLVN